ncbi:heparan-alpha-glucosaminide N-acetyltransferase [Pelosinus sp. sgz500959]|uniref:heparan-alpha-glucosaminide N-acetyltransferase n=1 Tax=Pelosinus sp. sgz500959 TaxID=3242472 RepID=UPI0036716C06
MIIHHRIWEIDFIRGLAIILMIIFHFIVDLKDFYSYPLDYLSGFWYLEGKLSAIIFMLICGVSSTLGKKSTRHGIKVFLWAMLLTLVTYLYNENYYIRFGILHFLGISLLSAHFIRRLPIYGLIILSCTTLIIGTTFSDQYISNPYLFPIGLRSNSFISMDYYPIFPWYGVFLSGIILGKSLYGDKKNFSVPKLSHHQPEVVISWLGQHSLAVYLTHQPILLLLLYLFHTVYQ